MSVLKPLAGRPIRLLWAGQVLSATGTEFYMVAVVWIASGLIGRDAGYVSALQAAALLAGSLLGGVITDRWPHRTTMIRADLARVALVLVLSVAGLFGAVPLPLLAIVAGCVALVSAVFDPALQATLPEVAPDPEFRHATNALFDSTRRAARIFGPGLIAVVNGILPTGQFFAVTGATFLLSALAVRAALPDRSDASARVLRGSAAVVDSLVGGIRAIKGHSLLIYGLCSNFIGNVTWGMGVLLGMMLLLRETRADPLTDYSLMMAAYGAGNLAANLVLGSAGPGRPAVRLACSKVIFGIGVCVLPFMPDRIALMAVAAFAALNGPFEALAMVHLMQTDLPTSRVAQAYRLQMCAAFGGLLFAYLAAPSLYGWFGLVPVIVASGVVTLAAGLVGFALFVRRGGTPQRGA